MPRDPITTFLDAGPCAGWRRDPIAGDASARRYERLTGPDGTAILMITPQELSAAQASFLRIGAHLRALGLAAPRVIASDESTGLVLLEDLGPDDFAAWLAAHPEDEIRLYSAAIDLLALLANAPLPEGLVRLDPGTAAAMTTIAWDWYAPQTDRTLVAEITAALRDALASYAPDPDTLALRDFHAQNLIWRDRREGLNRIGLIDFQDAVAAPRAYDLVSLLRDARRDVPNPLRGAMIARFATATNAQPEELGAACATLGVQRNLRILGVFARLARRDGKRGYLRLLPRVRAHIEDDLHHPALSALAPALRRALDAAPEPVA